MHNRNLRKTQLTLRAPTQVRREIEMSISLRWYVRTGTNPVVQQVQTHDHVQHAVSLKNR